MSTTPKVFTAEFMQEKKATVKGFTDKAAALAWAKERIADENVACIALWMLATTKPVREALAIAAEGRPWYEARVCLMVITRNGIRKVTA